MLLMNVDQYMEMPSLELVRNLLVVTTGLAVQKAQRLKVGQRQQHAAAGRRGSRLERSVGGRDGLR